MSNIEAAQARVREALAAAKERDANRDKILTAYIFLLEAELRNAAPSGALTSKVIGFAVANAYVLKPYSVFARDVWEAERKRKSE